MGSGGCNGTICSSCPSCVGGIICGWSTIFASRGNIYSNDGGALVAQADAVAIGLDTGKVDPNQENGLLGEIYRLTGVQPQTLSGMIEAWRPFGYYLPVADISVDDLAPREAVLAGYSGVILITISHALLFR